MEFLQQLFGRDVYNLICDYYHPISDLAQQRKEHMNKAFLMCYDFLYFKNHNFCYTFRTYERFLWIQRLRSADLFLNNDNKIKLRSRNQGIPEKYINVLYNLKGLYNYNHIQELIYKHICREEPILINYPDRTPKYPSGTPTIPTYL